jgi:hypothetical protein
MTMRSCLFVLLAACGGVSSDPQTMVGSFDDELPTFKDTLCTEESRCGGVDELACRNDVTADMANAKELLDPAGEQRCAECMHVKTRELQAILDANCDRSAGDEAAVLAACDLNPNDGVDKPDEACAGFP